MQYSVIFGVITAALVLFCIVILTLLVVVAANVYVDGAFEAALAKFVGPAIGSRNAEERSALWDYQRTRVNDMLRTCRNALVAGSGKEPDFGKVAARIINIIPDTKVKAGAIRLGRAKAIDAEDIVQKRARLQTSALDRIASEARRTDITLAKLSSKIRHVTFVERAKLRWLGVREFAPRIILGAAAYVAISVGIITVVALLVGAAIGVVVRLVSSLPLDYHPGQAFNVGALVCAVVGGVALVQAMWGATGAEPLRLPWRQKIQIAGAAVVAFLSTSINLTTDWLPRWVHFSTTLTTDAVDRIFASTTGIKFIFALLTLGCAYGAYRNLRGSISVVRARSLERPELCNVVASNLSTLPVWLAIAAMAGYSVFAPAVFGADRRVRSAPPVILQIAGWAWLLIWATAGAIYLVGVSSRARRRKLRFRRYRRLGLSPRYILHPGLLILACSLLLVIMGILITALDPATHVETAAALAQQNPWGVALALIFALGAPVAMFTTLIWAGVQVRRRRKQDQELGLVWRIKVARSVAQRG